LGRGVSVALTLGIPKKEINRQERQVFKLKKPFLATLVSWRFKIIFIIVRDFSGEQP
jgi:hypothetical protein